jgi:PadR family transcriptional regulator PadR
VSMRKVKRGRGGKAHPTDAPRITLRHTYWLEAVILVSLREMKSYGYELMRRVAKFGFEAINPGTFYRNLRHMENEGLVRSEWDTSKRGPARRMYSITDTGEAYLDFSVKALEEYRHKMDAFFRLYHGMVGVVNGSEAS